MITPEKNNRELITERLRNLQDQICTALEMADGKGNFIEDIWERPGGGGGRSRILQGQHIEKGGVNFSAVYGAITPVMLSKLQMPEGDFFATGVSIVLHPTNPMVPIIHMNIRYFEVNDPKTGQMLTCWFGGGIDLTPHYVDATQAMFFHKALRTTCNRFDTDFYARFKQWADDYFFIRHRNETRGIGGIFFDRLQPTIKHSHQNLSDFILAIGETFTPTYLVLLEENKHKNFNKKQKHWQKLRRGRYVEFNLVYDAGTKFGLETDGRTESILMSLPPEANWAYDFRVQKGSPEEQTLKYLRKGVNWLA